jgi:hypothetical protein
MGTIPEGAAIMAEAKPVRHRGAALVSGARMDEPRHDLLARSRLSEQQHGRLRGRDLRRLREHLAPGRGLADHAAVPGAGVQLIGERLDARLELEGAGRGRLRPLRRLQSPLAREAEGEPVRDPPGDREVRRPVERRRPRKEVERSRELALQADGHA